MFQKRGTYTTLDEYVYFKTGKTLAQLNQYKETYKIDKLELAAEMVKRAASAGIPIVVFADYDVDGFTSASEWIMLLTYLRAKFWVYAPKRSVDGYGLSVTFIDRLKNMPKGLLVTVDNGIAALDAVLAAKQIGWEVLIMDHHQAVEGDVLTVPRADLIIDPEVFSAKCDFIHYCGAGLTYKLAELIVADEYYLNQMCAIAAIGTVADVVELSEDNRRIVQKGLDVINRGQATVGINKIIERLQKTGLVTATDIGFDIGPMLNAASRLETLYGPDFSGSDFSISTLLCADEEQAVKQAMTLYEINLKRKEITKNALDSISTGNVDPVNFLKVDAPHGILGIIAARVAESTGKPTFIFSEHNGICAGSSRAGDSDNNVKALLDKASQYMGAYGGHPGAAGFSFPAENLEKIKDILNSQEILPCHPSGYDLELDQQLVMPTLIRMDMCEPFGKGLEKPLFKIKCNFNGRLEFWHAMGKDGSSLRFDLTDQIPAVVFNEKTEFLKHGSPRQFTIYGTPVHNIYQGKSYPQFKIDKIEY